MGNYSTKDGESKKGLWINGKFKTWHDDEEVMKSVQESIQDPNFVDMLERFKSDKECMKTLAQYQPKRNKSNSLRNIFKEKNQEETIEIPADSQKTVINSANFTPRA